MRNIVLIPGMGGHPSFHRALISALQTNNLVHTSAHIDFSGRPSASLAEHREYWRTFIEELGLRHVLIIGISFGAHVALGLPRLLRQTQAEAVILISYWPIERLERWLLAAVRLLPKSLTAEILGRILFKWSDLKTDDAAALRKIRSKLYDSRTQVFQRLRARLLCLSTDLSRSIHLPNCPIYFIYGKAETSVIMHRSFLSFMESNTNVRVIIVPGDHSISISRNRTLDHTLEQILEEIK